MGLLSLYGIGMGCRSVGGGNFLRGECGGGGGVSLIIDPENVNISVGAHLF